MGRINLVHYIIAGGATKHPRTAALNRHPRGGGGAET